MAADTKLAEKIHHTQQHFIAGNQVFNRQEDVQKPYRISEYTLIIDQHLRGGANFMQVPRTHEYEASAQKYSCMQPKSLKDETSHQRHIESRVSNTGHYLQVSLRISEPRFEEWAVDGVGVGSANHAHIGTYS